MIYWCAQVLLSFVIWGPERFQVRIIFWASGRLLLLLLLVGLFYFKYLGELNRKRELLQIDVGDELRLRILQIIYLLGHLVRQFNERLDLLVFIVVSEVLQYKVLHVVCDRAALGQVLEHAVGVFEVFAQIKWPSCIKGLLRGLSSQIFEMSNRRKLFCECFGGGQGWRHDRKSVPRLLLLLRFLGIRLRFLCLRVV